VKLFLSILLLLALALLALHWRGRSIAAEMSAAYPPIGDKLDLGGITLHVVDRGAKDAPPERSLVLIHGASGNLREMLLAFEGYEAAGYRLVAIDRPGHGWSERGDASKAVTLGEQARLVAATMETLGIGKAVIVGHSYGGAVASRVLLDHPQRVAGVLLISPVSHTWPGGIEWYYSVASTPVLGPIFANTLAPVAGKGRLGAGATSVFAPTPVPPDYVERSGIGLVLRPAEFVANAQDVAALYDEIVQQQTRYGGIDRPVEIITAETDTVVSPVIHSTALASAVMGAKLTVLEGAGHVPHHSRKAETRQALQRLERRILHTDR
jgi:pimeloyl-ACP methyl ester carboxylesterase